jgi:hypothetical protein
MFKLNVTAYQHASPICHEYYQHRHDSTQTHHQFAKQHINAEIKGMHFIQQ